MISNIKFISQIQSEICNLKFAIKKGQGLLEVVAAIGVLTTGIFSAVTLMNSSLNGSKENEARLIGSNLAREGIEAVRSIRDSNWLSGKRWDAGLEGVGQDYTGIAVFAAAGGSWGLDFSVDNLGDDGAAFLKMPDGLMIQAPPSGPPRLAETNYRRLITLNPICFDSVIGNYSIITAGACPDIKAGAEVRSEVEWYVGPKFHRASFVENLYDWR